MENGKKNWIFGDGDLPPAINGEPKAHEAMMVTNAGDQPARLSFEILFEDKEPVTGLTYTLPAKRVHCFRMDMPFADQGYKIPFGQYAVVLHADVPVVAVFGRLDRRENMAYYSTAGFGY